MASVLPNDISLNGLNFTRAQEGRALRAYQDSVGVWTIGYGLTNFDKGLPWKIEKGLTISEDQAEYFLLRSLRQNYLPTVRRVLEGGTYAHPQGMVDGGSDMHYNTGGIAKASFPAAFKAGDMAAAQTSLMSWNKAGGSALAGLTRRRAGNWKEMTAGDYGHLTGPAVVEPRANNQERIAGTGTLLTAMPEDHPGTEAGNVKVDGVPTPSTPAPGVLKLGSTGQAVTDLQNKLTAAGYPTRVTGLYDDQTVANVTAFQKAHPSITADGKTGPATLSSLDRAIALRGLTNKTVKTALPSIPGIFIAFHKFVGENAGEIALAVGVGALVLFVGYWAVRYRHEIHAHINGLLGRAVT